jgi:(p)ppGpp synthase/HD superfamily hydrolase|tara:strand:+ start:30815 stop:31012 length:198 start_codon:yes stop_codon:yes gene_type:complete
MLIKNKTKKMSKQITISEETLKMLISMAHQEGYKLAHQTLSDLNVDTLSNKVADKLVESLKPKQR